MYNKRVVFWSACLGMLLFGVTLITLGSISTDLKVKLHLDEIAAGTMFSILPFGILTGSLLFGPIADKYGYRILMFVSCILLSMGFEGIAFTSSSGFLKICVFFIGLSGGAVNGATNALVSDISDKDKTANMSLLGVFFGIGALGMPLILGTLREYVNFEKVVALIGIISLITGIIFILIKLPPPKTVQKISIILFLTFLKDPVIILIAFFLFFQSSLEGIINNWSTTYLTNHLSFPNGTALYALSLFVAGMAIMRLITGTILKQLPVVKIIIVSFTLILLGLSFIKLAITPIFILTGFVLLGAGLAGGFPIMFGFVGARYASSSGTAFSFILFVALLGNMLVNYSMGFISGKFGISYLLAVALTETIIMAILCNMILKLIKTNK